MEEACGRQTPRLKRIVPEDLTRHDEPYESWLDVMKDIRNGIHALLEDLATADLEVNWIIKRLERDDKAEVTVVDLVNLATLFGEIYETSDELLDIVDVDAILDGLYEEGMIE